MNHAPSPADSEWRGFESEFKFAAAVKVVTVIMAADPTQTVNPGQARRGRPRLALTGRCRESPSPNPSQGPSHNTAAMQPTPPPAGKIRDIMIVLSHPSHGTTQAPAAGSVPNDHHADPPQQTASATKAPSQVGIPGSGGKHTDKWLG